MDRLGGTFGSHDHSDEHEYDIADDDAGLDPPPSPVGQDERRMQVRAYNHWASLLANRNFPSIEDLEPETLDDFGPYSVLLDFTGGIEDPAIQFLGRKLADECSAEDQIDRLSDVPSRSLLSRITDHYMQILANQAPIGFEAEFVNQRGMTALYRGILLPYSSDNDTIDFIYGVINWKEMADQQAADELLLEIDQALETGRELDAQAEDIEATDEGPDMLDLGETGSAESGARDLPLPAFGAPAISGAGDEPPADGIALGAVDEGEAEEILDAESEYAAWSDDEEPDYSVDYGLAGLEEDPEGDDVDDVVDPLADEDIGSSLLSLVSRGEKRKPMVELNPALGGDGESPPPTTPVVPIAYEPEEPASFAPEPEIEPEAELQAADETEIADGQAGPEPVESEAELETHSEEAELEADAEDGHETDFPADEEPEGLYDTLAAARELAQVARNNEDRTRTALYQAVGRAYDFSLEAEANPAEFEELMAENGLTIQDRAPMTPVVKLVFGADYDKTRLTEYAAVLTHARRAGLARGTLAKFLAEAEGGLKGVVQAERRARKEDAGKPVEAVDGVRESLAKRLRKLEPIDFADLDPQGPEFALVMVRRLPTGELVVVGEVPEDTSLVERAARKLIG